MKSGIKMFLSVFLSISAIVVATGITVQNYMKNKFEETTANDMRVVSDIADRLVVNSINRLYFGISTVASMLYDNPSGEWDIKLKRLNDKMADFLGISVIDTNGNIVISSGKYPIVSDDCIAQSVEMARKNGIFISSTHISEHGDNPLVFHVSTSIIINEKDTLFIAGSVDGMYFSDILNSFTFWKSGHLNMNDADGYVLANPREEWVKNRKNFLKEDPAGYEEFVAMLKNMTEGKTGTTEYNMSGIRRIALYRPISVPGLGWSISLVAPKNEGPFTDLGTAIKWGGLIGLLLGLVVALVNGVFASKTFNKMEKLRKEAIHASKEKSRFLSNMSHEMRTPLNAIIGFSELALGSDQIDGENRKYVENIHNSGITLLGLINDILDLSKIEAGKYEIVPVNYYTASMINDVISTNIVKIGSKNIDLRVSCKPDMLAKLNGDNLRVKQIFNNVLSNAVKYTKEGFVEWKIWTEKTADGLFIVSSVEDSGIGIKKEDVEKLFSAYSQVNTKSNRKVEGTGLGLSITKKLLEFMNGDIKVESEYGKGTIFTFRFKQGFVSDEVIGEEVSKKLKEFKYIDFNRSKKSKLVRNYIPDANVLVVDDVTSNLEVAKGLMKPYGMKIDIVSSGKEAVDLIRKAEKKYNVIFMDHMMPEMDGIEAVRIIRNEIGTEYAENVPIVALTANAMVGNDKMFLEAGFNDFLSKPIDVMRLDVIINRWCRDKLYTANNETSNSETHGIDSWNINGLDTQKGLEFVGFEYKIYFDIIETFVRGYDEIRGKLENFFTAKDISNYTITVHGFKSGLRMVGAMELGESAENLEFKSRDKDWDFVEKNHREFIDKTDILIKQIAVKLNN